MEGKWGTKEAITFQWVKQQLVKSPLLQYYDTATSLSLSTDVSPYGVVAVLLHLLEDSSERPVAYASHTLTNMENGTLNSTRKLSQMFSV